MALVRIHRQCRRCNRPSLLITPDPRPKAWP